MCGMAIFAAWLSPPLNAQSAAPSHQSALANEAGTLSDKFSGLARVMAGKYEWKPGESVRSAGDVFNLIVRENGMLSSVLSGAGAPGRGGPRPALITDADKLQEALNSRANSAITCPASVGRRRPSRTRGFSFTPQPSRVITC